MIKRNIVEELIINDVLMKNIFVKIKSKHKEKIDALITEITISWKAFLFCLWINILIIDGIPVWRNAITVNTKNK